MAGALKTFFSPALVRRLGADIARVHPRFPERAFVKSATAGLDELELLDRGRHIARSLASHLPAEYPDAIDVLLRSLGPEHASDELVGAGMEPFFSCRTRSSAPGASSVRCQRASTAATRRRSVAGLPLQM